MKGSTLLVILGNTPIGRLGHAPTYLLVLLLGHPFQLRTIALSMQGRKRSQRHRVLTSLVELLDASLEVHTQQFMSNVESQILHQPLFPLSPQYGTGQTADGTRLLHDLLGNLPCSR